MDVYSPAEGLLGTTVKVAARNGAVSPPMIATIAAMNTGIGRKEGDRCGLFLATLDSLSGRSKHNMENLNSVTGSDKLTQQLPVELAADIRVLGPASLKACRQRSNRGRGRRPQGR